MEAHISHLQGNVQFELMFSEQAKRGVVFLPGEANE